MEFRKYLALLSLLFVTTAFAADTKISALAAVATPASTDEFVVNQGGTSKKQTRAQIHELQAGESFSGNNASGPTILNVAATATVPTLVPNKADPDTGQGWNGNDILVNIAGAATAQQFKESAGSVIKSVQGRVGLTAHTGSSQGDGSILSSYNVYTVVGTAGDAATLPSTFFVFTIIFVKNDAATNSMDVFPASGDDAGAGDNVAVAIAAGDFAVFFATAANATWTKLMGGTA